MSVLRIQMIRRGNQLAVYRPILLMILALVIVFGAAGFSEPIPTIEITAVEQGKSITFVTNNYPANQEFTVTMGHLAPRAWAGLSPAALIQARADR